MPFNKKYKPKRGRKGRKMIRYKQPSGIGKADYSSKFYCEPLEFSNDSTVPLKQGLASRLEDVNNFSTWTTIFDQFRINKVVWKFVPVQTTVVNRPFDDSTNPGASVSEVPRLAMCIDRDDENTPLDFDAVARRPGSKVIKATKGYTFVFKPTRLLNVYRSATSTGYMLDPNTKAFLDVANGSQIPHYGMKWVLEPSSPSNCYQYRIERTYYISWKNRRY